MANFTQEQLRAIESQGRTIVSASAGSSKTTVMIEKIIRLIKDGTGVGEILAVTFTKKAAAQMKEKLCKELIEEIKLKRTTIVPNEKFEKIKQVPLNREISLNVYALTDKGLEKTENYFAE